MKTLRILMAVLFMSAIFVSCGSSPADDGKKAGELACKVANAASDMDAKELEKLTKESEDFAAEMKKKYEGKDVKEEDKKAFEDAMKAALDACKK